MRYNTVRMYLDCVDTNSLVGQSHSTEISIPCYPCINMVVHFTIRIISSFQVETTSLGFSPGNFHKIYLGTVSTCCCLFVRLV